MQQYPLYRDVVQPVALAVSEVRCGLALLVYAASSKPDQALADAVLEDCMHLPSHLGQGRPFSKQPLTSSNPPPPPYSPQNPLPHLKPPPLLPPLVLAPHAPLLPLLIPPSYSPIATPP